VLHQVGVSFDLYCDARKHIIKIPLNLVRSSYSISFYVLLTCATQYNISNWPT